MPVKTYFINQNDIDKLIHQYTVENLSKNKLSEIWECNSSCIKKVLLNNNIKIRTSKEQKKLDPKQKSWNTIIFTDSQIKEICHKYVNLKYPIRGLAREYNIGRLVVKRILKENNIKIDNDIKLLRATVQNNGNYDKIITLDKICENINHIFKDYEIYIKAAERCWLENTLDVNIKINNILIVLSHLNKKSFVGSFIGNMYCPILFLYIYINKQNGKLYIGQTNDLIARHEQHIKNSKKIDRNSQGIDRSMNKWGPENFIFLPFLTIKNSTQDEIDDLERFFIKIFNCRKEGYNEHDGGGIAHRINLSNEIVESIIIKYNQRDADNKYFLYTEKALSAEFNISPQTIRRIVSNKGYTLRTVSEGKKGKPNGSEKYFINKEDIDKLIYQYTVEKLGMLELSKIWNCSTVPIKHHLLKNDIQLRSLSEQKIIGFIQRKDKLNETTA